MTTASPESSNVSHFLEEDAEDLYQNAPCGFLSMRPDGTIIKANATFLQWTGFTLEQLIDKRHFQDLLPVASRIFYDTHFGPLLLMQGFIKELAFELVCADGRRLPVLLNSQLKRDASARPLVIRTVLLDASGRRAYEEELRLAKRKAENAEDALKKLTGELQVANKELEAFAHSVSHDLRAPLTTIEGLSQILLRSEGKNLGPKSLHCLSRIRAATEQMGALIDAMLSLAKVSRGPLNYAPVDLSDLAVRLNQECREREPERQVEVTIQEDLQVQGDAFLLSIVMRNLLGNAWKYSNKVIAAKIEVGSETVGGGGRAGNSENVYFVRDNGAGFDMAYADKLFGAFQRLHASQDFEGNGVGLANVKRVIERHGGRVWAQGRVGGGATFYFTLGLCE